LATDIVATALEQQSFAIRFAWPAPAGRKRRAAGLLDERLRHRPASDALARRTPYACAGLTMATSNFILYLLAVSPLACTVLLFALRGERLRCCCGARQLRRLSLSNVLLFSTWCCSQPRSTCGFIVSDRAAAALPLYGFIFESERRSSSFGVVTSATRPEPAVSAHAPL
jgi:hypothetical protein